MSSERAITPRRGFIFAPRPSPRARISCVELKDGIAPADKAAARRNAMALFDQAQASEGVERIVRINCVRTAFGLDDVQAVLAWPSQRVSPPGLAVASERRGAETARIAAKPLARPGWRDA